ncbi:hypothetical protein EJB05_28722, partial [Eragrostis curvula]
MEWVLKSDISLRAVVENFPYDDERYSRPWIVNYHKDANKAQEEDEFEWDFDSVFIFYCSETEVLVTPTGNRVALICQL